MGVAPSIPNTNRSILLTLEMKFRLTGEWDPPPLPGHWRVSDFTLGPPAPPKPPRSLGLTQGLFTQQLALKHVVLQPLCTLKSPEELLNTKAPASPLTN